jgi:hypothetical protein
MSKTQEDPAHPLTSVLFWDHFDVTVWLSSIHLETYILQFKWNCIDGLSLLELTSRDLKLLDVAHRDQSYLLSKIDLLRSNLPNEIIKWNNKSVRKWFRFNGFTRSQANIFRYREFDGQKFLRVTRQSMAKIGAPKNLQMKVLFLQTLALGQIQSHSNQTHRAMTLQFQQPPRQSQSPQQPFPTTTPHNHLQHQNQQIVRQGKLNSAPVTSLLHLWKPRKDERESKHQLSINSEPINTKKISLNSDEVYIEIQSVSDNQSRWRMFREGESFTTFQNWVESEYGPNYKAKCWVAGQVGGIRSDTDISILCRMGRMQKTKVILHEVPII